MSSSAFRVPIARLAAAQAAAKDVLAKKKRKEVDTHLIYWLPRGACFY